MSSLVIAVRLCGCNPARLRNRLENLQRHELKSETGFFLCHFEDRLLPLPLQRQAGRQAVMRRVTWARYRGATETMILRPQPRCHQASLLVVFFGRLLLLSAVGSQRTTASTTTSEPPCAMNLSTPSTMWLTEGCGRLDIRSWISLLDAYFKSFAYYWTAGGFGKRSILKTRYLLGRIREKGFMPDKFKFLHFDSRLLNDGRS
ncbi:hypothetical protein ACLOJK_011794 [Asimina triloba]